MTVFIIEDNKLLSLLFARMVQGLGHTVAGQAISGEQAIRDVAATRPDMLIVDIQLAGALSGIEAVAEIRNHQSIPVIYASANTDLMAQEEQRNPSCAEFLAKPVSRPQLGGAIDQLAATCGTALTDGGKRG